MPSLWIVRAAALSGATGVALGAFGAHGLQRYMPDANLESWRTAVLYHLIHSVVLLALGLNGGRSWGSCSGHVEPVVEPVAEPRHFPAYAFGLGIILFSGSLYCLAVGGPRWLGPVTPLGGASFILGWLLLWRLGASHRNQ